jgi:DNA polymerase III subunit epsilon
LAWFSLWPNFGEFGFGSYYWLDDGHAVRIGKWPFFRTIHPSPTIHRTIEVNVSEKAEQLIEKLEASGNYKVIRKLKKVEGFHEDPNAKKKIGVVLDTETTGFDFATEKIIELGMIFFEFSSDGRIFKIIKEFDQFEDPGKPIPKEITELTGITDQDVKGKRIDDQEVNSLVQSAVLVIAHNAAFDRPFVERRFPIFETKYWACSQTQIPWKNEGVLGTKLIYLAYSYSFFYPAHRAIDDCWALLKILTSDLPKSGHIVLNTLLSNAREATYLIEAIGAPFNKKEILKAREYRCDGDKKCWFKELTDQEVEDEEEFLKNVVYEDVTAGYEKTKITGKERFSRR